jgi:oxygen-dependent protoporphyrinogen oxidase
MQRIAVIGGGIAGLTVALRRADAGDQVTLFEAGPKFGGQLSSESLDGFLIEHGAEGFVARSEAVPALAADAGIPDRLVDQLEQRSFRFDGTQLIELAPGEAGRLLGFQVPADELGRGIRSFVRGMGELPEQLALKLLDRVALHLNSKVKSVAAHANGVTLISAEGQASDFSGLVVATTAPSAASLLGDAFGPIAQALQGSTQLSSLTVSLAFRREAIAHPLHGTGFIVPKPEQLDGLRAVTFSSSKLPQRAPADHALLRLFFRPSEHDLLTLSDAAWAERGVQALAKASALSAALSGRKIWLAGAAFHGSGIDAAIRSAESAAKAISQ